MFAIAGNVLWSVRSCDLHDDLEPDDRRYAGERQVAADGAFALPRDPADPHRRRTDQLVVGEDVVREDHDVDRVRLG